MEEVGKNRGGEREKVAWEKREGRAPCHIQTLEREKGKDYEDIWPQQQLNTPLT
jgi:hypothetical protein